MELRKVAGKFALVLARKRNVGAVKVRQLARRKGNGSNGGDRAGNPAEGLLFLRDFTGGVGELVANVIELFQKLAALGFQFPRFHFERSSVGPRQSFRDRTYRAFQLFAAVQVALEDA